ncbi:MAG: DUF3078 domain-containing protein [Prevotella sp.]
MILKHILTVLCLTLSVTVSAQRQKTPRQEVSPVVAAYVDSLISSKVRIDSTTNVGKHTANGQLYRLFIPLTFYHSTAQKSLSLFGGEGQEDAIDDAVDETLLSVYLSRPDLVVTSERDLKKAGGIREDLEQPVKPKVDLSKHVKPIPDVVDDIPVNVMIRKPNFWSFSGDGNLQFLQNYVSGNWYKGGESNYSMVGGLTFKAIYNNKSKLKVDNTLELKLGFQTSKADTLHKFKTNNDLIRYTGKLGLQATKGWYYTLQLLAYTQFTRGYRSNDSFVYSDFMSPLNLNLGLGMDYAVNTLNGKLKGNVNLSPLSFNFRYVGRKALAANYGIKGDHQTMEDFGSQLTTDITWILSDIVKWKTRLYAYTTYERTEIEWENTVSLQVSKYISANIFVYPRFDDSTKRDEDLGYWQFKEYCSLGFAYSF